MAGDITFFGRRQADVVVNTPTAYLIPQAWREVIERLQWNGVHMTRLTADQTLPVQTYRIASVTTRPTPYEGHMFHDAVELTQHTETVRLQAGDYVVHLNQPQARYAVETLEPQAHDSFFRWGFFNSVLEKKEGFSDYAFEDTALKLLRDEPVLRCNFDAWKAANPQHVYDQAKVLQFIHTHCQRFAEPEWLRYLVFGLLTAL